MGAAGLQRCDDLKFPVLQAHLILWLAHFSASSKRELFSWLLRTTGVRPLGFVCKICIFVRKTNASQNPKAKYNGSFERPHLETPRGGSDHLARFEFDLVHGEFLFLSASEAVHGGDVRVSFVEAM